MKNHGRVSLLRYLSLVLAAAAVSISCSKADEGSESVSDSNSNMADFAQGAVGSMANESESGVVGTSAMPFIFPEEQANYGPLSTCTWSSARSVSCASSTIAVNWGGCTSVGGDLTLTGGWTSTFNSSAACSAFESSGGPGNGNHLTRTSASGFTVRFSSGMRVTSSTEAHTAYDGTAIPETGIRVQQTSATVTDRSITIFGLHRILRGPRGTKWFDHSLKTDAALTVTGTRSGGTRTVNGTLTVFHNLARYTATNVMTNVKWGTSTCCYPTSGTIATSFSGTVTGTATTTFTTNCGIASFVDTTGTTSTVTLRSCE